jgi:hypothetical protein
MVIPVADTEPKKEGAAMPFRKKIMSAATWGMLSGFWVELPMLTAFMFKPFRPSNHEGWAKLNELAVKIVLPATLAGVGYGWFKPGIEQRNYDVHCGADRKAKSMNINEEMADMPPVKSWVNVEKIRQTAPSTQPVR